MVEGENVLDDKGFEPELDDSFRVGVAERKLSEVCEVVRWLESIVDLPPLRGRDGDQAGQQNRQVVAAQTAARLREALGMPPRD